MRNLLKVQIETFLDVFLKVEHKGKDQFVARNHFREIFNKLILKYFDVKHSINQNNTPSINDNKLNNIVILGAGCGELTAAFKLEKASRKNPGYKFHLIYKNPSRQLKTPLNIAVYRNKEVLIPICQGIRKTKVVFESGIKLKEVNGAE